MGIIVTLRERLRADTRVSHDAVDVAFGRFDIRNADGLARFLLAQRTAIGVLRRASATDPLRDEVCRAVDDLDADLATLGGGRSWVDLGAMKAPVDDHVLARAYIWHGSRLGTRMLARRWSDAADPSIREAGTYFARLADRSVWRGLTDALDAESGRGRKADRVTGAANDWFAIFEDAAGRARAAEIEARQGV